MNAAGKDGVDVDSCPSLQRLEKLLRPFDHLPNEVVVAIFEFVYVDWERLPSPFQLCHVNKRWREIAFATPALWRDTRILRVATRIATTKDHHCDRVKRPPSFAHEAIVPPSYGSHPKTGNHLRLLELCDKHSKSTIRYFEYHTLQSDGGLAEAMLASVFKSAATLRAISVINKDGSVNDSDRGIAWQALAFVLRCPKLEDLEFSAGSIWSDDRETLEEELAFSPASTSASLRTVKLDIEDCQNFSRLPLARQTFLSRASQIRSLSLVNVASIVNDEGDPARFAGELLATCAASLEELDATVCSGLFDAAREAGATVLPSLKRLRHAPAEGEDEPVVPISALELPNLETLAAPLRVVRGFGKLPARIVLHIFGEHDLKRLCGWLQSLNDDQAPQHLTLELLCRRDLDTRLTGLIDVMTPSVAGRVVCPRLATLDILCKDALRQHDIDGNVFDFHFVPRRKPTTRDQWEELLDASRLVRLEAERRRVSQGLPIYGQTARVPPAFRRGAVRVSPEQDSDTEGATTILPKCEELRSITIESCFVKKTAWDSMKASPCAFVATPDPDEMAKLPWEGGGKDRQYGER